MAYHNELGKIGEQLAVDFLLRKGFKILERNYTFQKAEIDIIAEKENVIIIIEVKTRNSAFFGDPQDFVSKSKVKLLIKAANEYLVANEIVKETRFDIIAVLKNKNIEQIEHIENAFYHF